MDTEIKIVRGPSSTRLTKEAAASELQKLPGFPQEASFTIEEVDGRWVAAVLVPKVGWDPFPPAADDSAPAGPPADDPVMSRKSPDRLKSESKPKEDDKGDEAIVRWSSEGRRQDEC
jgi:hypothetical protein